MDSLILQICYLVCLVDAGNFQPCAEQAPKLLSTGGPGQSMCKVCFISYESYALADAVQQAHVQRLSFALSRPEQYP